VADPAAFQRRHTRRADRPVADVERLTGQSQRPRPEKPVRFTLDLDRAHHQFLKDQAVKLESGASKVMRALLDELRDDSDLQNRVRTRVWQTAGH
jgi:hypothetical protein